MAPPPDKNPAPQRAADAILSRTFDPWNSVGADHQRAETRTPPGWRESRNLKLREQFAAGHTGGPRMSDTVGAGSEDFDERLGVLIPRHVRARVGNSVVDMLKKQAAGVPATIPASTTASGGRESTTTAVLPDESPAADEDPAPGKNKIFDGLVVYVNGSTHPLVSDHKLKRMLAENGARMSLHLGRRQVTHVILGRPTGSGSGAGGGLAGGKLEREIRRVGGCGIKYVGAEWVLESVKAGKRLPEARFSNLKVAMKGQQSVYGAFSKTQI